jgi:hypothetical protein
MLWRGMLRQTFARRSGARPQAESPESITPEQWLWIPGSPSLRYGARNDAAHDSNLKIAELACPAKLDNDPKGQPNRATSKHQPP